MISYVYATTVPIALLTALGLALLMEKYYTGDYGGITRIVSQYLGFAFFLPSYTVQLISLYRLKAAVSGMSTWYLEFAILGLCCYEVSFVAIAIDFHTYDPVATNTVSMMLLIMVQAMTIYKKVKYNDYGDQDLCCSLWRFHRTKPNEEIPINIILKEGEETKDVTAIIPRRNEDYPHIHLVFRARISSAISYIRSMPANCVDAPSPSSYRDHNRRSLLHWMKSFPRDEFDMTCRGNEHRVHCYCYFHFCEAVAHMIEFMYDDDGYNVENNNSE